MSYVLMQYRRTMGISYDQQRAMPLQALKLDLEQMELESQYGPDSIKST